MALPRRGLHANALAAPRLRPTVVMDAKFVEDHVIQAKLYFSEELRGKVDRLTSVTVNCPMRLSYKVLVLQADGEWECVSGDTPFTNDESRRYIQGGTPNGEGGARAVIDTQEDGTLQSQAVVLIVLSGEPEFVDLELRFDGNMTMGSSRKTVVNHNVVKRIKDEDARRKEEEAVENSRVAQMLRSKYNVQ